MKTFLLVAERGGEVVEERIAEADAVDVRDAVKLLADLIEQMAPLEDDEVTVFPVTLQ